MTKTEITFSGYGGQGVVISSIICANALSLEGYNVLQTQSYGIEARGGASKGELIYSDTEVNYLEVDEPSILVMMSEEACQKYSNSIKADGVAIMDSFYVEEETINAFKEKKAKTEVYCEPFSEISLKHFGVALFTNVIVLGYLSGISEDIGVESMRASVKKNIKAKFIEKNMEALAMGYELAKEELKTREKEA